MILRTFRGEDYTYLFPVEGANEIASYVVRLSERAFKIIEESIFD